jgi:DNA-directed RNA polymerase subunit beta'
MITTVGQMMVQDALPASVRTNAVIDKGGLGRLLKQVADKEPKRYGEIVGKLKDIGNFSAFITGTSYSLDDLAPETGMRDQLFKKHGRELEALRKEIAKDPSRANHPEMLKRKAAVFSRIEEDMNAHMGELLKTPNGLTGWVASGAKGDKSMLRQMVGMTGLNVDVAGRLVPEIARNSFSEGLSPIDHLVHANGARRGVVNTYTSVREPGAFAKELNTISADMVITQADCGSSDGVVLAPDHPDALDRCLGQDVPGIAHKNDIWTPSLAEAARKKQTGNLVFRSPLHCHAHEGVCARCFGLNEEGRLPPVGEHVGLKAAQAITEPLTQLALNTKHTGGVIGAGKSPFQQIMQMMHAPKNFTGAATLARVGGAVTAIEEAPAGGHQVTVAGVVHYVPPDFAVVARRGQVLRRGDALSEGQLHPAEVVEHRGMDEGRRQFAAGVQKLYADAGIRGHGKIFETIARGVLNLGQVVQPGAHEFVPGEVVHWNAVAPLMKEPLESVPLWKSEGRILADDHGPARHYQVVTPRLLKDMEAAGHQDVTVYRKNALVVQPVMMGTERAALHKGDWMANLGFRFLGSRFKENAATAAVTNIHGWNPFPAYAAGSEFGKGPGGRF